MLVRSKINLCALGLALLFGLCLVEFTPAKTEADTQAALFNDNERVILEAFASGDDKAFYNALLDAINAEPDAKSSRAERERYAVLCELFNDVASRFANPRKVLYDLDSRPEHEEVDWLRAQAALRAGERDQIAEIEERLGFINGWIVCGPFDNERGAGFESAYPPESVKPNFTDEYAGKSELAVKWRAVTVQPRLGYINLDESMTPDDEALAYAFTTIEAEKDCDAVLSLACDEGYRIWLNGMPLSTGSANGRNVHRPCTFDQDTFDITLFKGTNTLLLKITEEENAWGFRVRVTGDGLKRASRAEAASWVRRISENPASVPDTIDFKHGVRRDMDERTGDAPSLFWGGLYELFRAPSERKDRVAMHLLEKTHALKLSGNDAAHVCYFLAQASGSTAETKAGTEENRRREMMLETLEHNDRYVPALLWLADYYADTLQIPTRAEEYALRALETAPGNIAATMALARSYWLRDMRDEYERLCRELLERKPDDSRVYRYLGYFERAAGRKAEALKMYERALLLDASDAYVQRQMLEQLADGDDLEDYSERMTRAHELLPFSTQLYLDEAAVHAGRGDEQKALALLELALEIAPDDDVVLAESARMATRVSDTLRRQAAIEGVTELDGIPAVELAESLRVKALAWLEYALERNPRRADIQRYVQFLRDETPVWEVRLQRDIGDLIASKLAEKSPADDIARIVYSDEICHVFADGGSQRFFHIAYKVTNDDGRQALQRYPLRESGDTRVVAARVHKAKDGRVEDSRVERVSTAQFRGLLITNSSLEVGDIFEVRYRIADTQRTFFGDYFGDIASFGHMVPVDVMRATWVLPNKRQFYFYERKASGLQRSESEQDGHRVVTYEGRDIARTEDEPFSPPLMQIAPTVYISTFKDWKSWGAWYWGLIERQVRSTPAIKEQVAELTKGLEREQDIVRAIYNFTVTKIRYNSNWEFGVHGYKPYEAGAIFDRCIGDCKDKAILICAMLREAGIKAYPVIINAEMYRGHEDITLALPNHFNHC
ncbi:MAG: DUF3857 domain-containing protein, partial [Planctomycetes bacterium]|nr:DUF3857 domain-containing protein [Planctomycetota bacterium]